MKKEHPFYAVPMDKIFVDNHNDYENYVLVYSKAMARFYGGENLKDVGNNNDAIEGLVKVRRGYNKPVYRKCKAKCGMKADEVAMGYRTMRKLGIDKGKKVQVSRANWFCYLLHHPDSTIKWPFIIAFVALLLTAAQAIISIVKLFC